MVKTIEIFFSVMWIAITHLVLTILFFAFLALLISYVQFRHSAHKHGAILVVWWHLTGYPMNGKYKGNAGWLTPGLEGTKWQRVPRLWRMSIRLGIYLALILMAYGEIVARTLTDVSLYVGLTTAVSVAVWRVWRQARGTWHSRQKVGASSKALCKILDVSEMVAAESLTLVQGWKGLTRGTVGRIFLPDHFLATDEQTEAIRRLMKRRLGKDLTLGMHLDEDKPYVELQIDPQPPSTVPYEKWREFIANLDEGVIFHGVDKHEAAYTATFNGDDSPMWGGSCGSGTGKSTHLQAICAQVLGKNPMSPVSAIDPKYVSFAPLIGVPGFRLANNPNNIDEMWKVIEDFFALIQERLQILDRDPTAEFPLALLAIDELNTFYILSKVHWKKKKSPKDPAIPPIFSETLPIIAVTGRQVRCHMIIVGQRLDDKSTGGMGLKDALGFRFLAGYRKNQFDFLIGITPWIRPQRGRGRWLYSNGQHEVFVQNVLMTPQQIRDLAMTGRTGKQPVKGEVIS